MRDVCGDGGSSSLYTCDPQQWTWEHQWTKTIINFIIEREDLDLLQDTNFIAFAASTFNSFDTSVFSRQEGSDLENEQNNSLASTGRKAITFLLTIDFLPCRPDDEVLLNAWEDILPWVSEYNSQCILMFKVVYPAYGMLISSYRLTCTPRIRIIL